MPATPPGAAAPGAATAHPPSGVGFTHRPFESQIVGATQSLTDTQDLPQAPLPEHL